MILYVSCILASIGTSIIMSLLMEAYHQRRASEEVGVYDKHRH